MFDKAHVDMEEVARGTRYQWAYCNIHVLAPHGGMHYRDWTSMAIMRECLSQRGPPQTEQVSHHLVDIFVSSYSMSWYDVERVAMSRELHMLQSAIWELLGGYIEPL